MADANNIDYRMINNSELKSLLRVGANLKKIIFLAVV